MNSGRKVPTMCRPMTTSVGREVLRENRAGKTADRGTGRLPPCLMICVQSPVEGGTKSYKVSSN